MSSLFTYTEPSLTAEQLTQKLLSDGLQIADNKRSERSPVLHLGAMLQFIAH